MHMAMLGQALHALWTGGYFDVVLGSSTLAALPADIRVALDARLPPVVELSEDGRVVLSLGAVQVQIRGADPWGEPLEAMIGVRASARPELSDESLTWSDVRIDERHVSLAGQGLSERAGETLTEALEVALAALVSHGLGDVLPALPIPVFVLPERVEAYGLPAGAALHLMQPELTKLPPHLVIEGGFGLRSIP
jgi:hypothetical protein